MPLMNIKNALFSRTVLEAIIVIAMLVVVWEIGSRKWISLISVTILC